MSNTKIVIDKEEWDSANEWLKRRHLNSEITELFRNATEIQIDQSIEERAKLKYPFPVCESIKHQKLEEAFTNAKRNYFIEGATQQQIIEQLKVKELKVKIVDDLLEQMKGCHSEYHYKIVENYLDNQI